VAGCCECGDEPSGSCATELVSPYLKENTMFHHYKDQLVKADHLFLETLTSFFHFDKTHFCILREENVLKVSSKT
jgi:hypothetical protein